MSVRFGDGMDLTCGSGRFDDDSSNDQTAMHTTINNGSDGQQDVKPLTPAQELRKVKFVVFTGLSCDSEKNCLLAPWVRFRALHSLSNRCQKKSLHFATLVPFGQERVKRCCCCCWLNSTDYWNCCVCSAAGGSLIV